MKIPIKVNIEVDCDNFYEWIEDFYRQWGYEQEQKASKTMLQQHPDERDVIMLIATGRAAMLERNFYPDIMLVSKNGMKKLKIALERQNAYYTDNSDSLIVLGFKVNVIEDLQADIIIMDSTYAGIYEDATMRVI